MENGYFDCVSPGGTHVSPSLQFQNVFVQLFRVDRGDLGASRLTDEDKVDRRAELLLVREQRAVDVLAVIFQLGRQTDMLEDADEALGQILVAEHGGQAHRRDHADRDGLTGVLASDPRPSYQHDPERIYGMEFAGLEVHFKVDGEVLTVTGVDRR